MTAESVEVAWIRKLEGESESSPAVADGTVYAGFDQGLAALSLSDGPQEWLTNSPEIPRSSPAVAGGAVYVGANDNFLYAL